MIQNFENWKGNNFPSEEVNEFFGLGKLFKAFFKNLSAPVKQKIEIITKNIDNKTGKVKNAKDLANDLINTFKTIADDKKADLNGIDSIEDIKLILKEFFMEVKAVFNAARVPFSAMVINIKESATPEQLEILNEIFSDTDISEKQRGKIKSKNHFQQRKEKISASNAPKDENPPVSAPEQSNTIKSDFADVMKNTKPEDFEDALDKWLDEWMKRNNDNVKKLEIASVKMIDTMMNTFQKKIKGFGEDRLSKLIELSSKKPEVKSTEVKSILDELPSDASIDASATEDEVETKNGKEEFIDAIIGNIENIEVEKVKKPNGTFDVTFRGVKL